MSCRRLRICRMESTFCDVLRGKGYVPLVIGRARAGGVRRWLEVSMAAGSNCQSAWRVVFGNTDDWMEPKVEKGGAMSEAAQSPVTWRRIFGSTAAWLPPQVDSPESTAEGAPSERCELCRQPIGEGQDFVTNGAGQRATHTRCLGMEPGAIKEGTAPSRTWLGLLSELVKP